MRIILIDNWEAQLSIIKGIFNQPGIEVKTIEFKSRMNKDNLLYEINELITDDTCIVLDLFLRIREEKRQVVDLEECIAIKTVKELLESLKTQGNTYSNLRVFFMSNLILADNANVTRVNKLFSKYKNYVATLQKPVIKKSDDTYELDSGEFMGQLYQENLEEKYLTTNIQDLFVNMILHGRH